MQVPGVHVIEMALAVASPVQLWGPLKVIFPAALTVPLKASNGAAKESAQLASVTTNWLPTSDESQCSVTVQVPLTSGHAVFSGPPSPAALGGSDELQLHTPHRASAANKARIIAR